MSVIRKLFEDGSSEVLPNMGRASVGDVVRIEDNGTPDMGSWIWLEVISKGLMPSLDVTQKSQSYASRYEGIDYPIENSSKELIFSTVDEFDCDKRVLVYLSLSDKDQDSRFVEFVVWLDDKAQDIYGVIFNPLEDVRVYLRVHPTGKTTIGMQGGCVDPTAGYYYSLDNIPKFVMDSISERIQKKINNPNLML